MHTTFVGAIFLVLTRRVGMPPAKASTPTGLGMQTQDARRSVQPPTTPSV